MPIYEYACSSCGKEFEAPRTISERDAAIACPHCGKGNGERLMSSFAATNGLGLDTAGEVKKRGKWR